MNTRNFFERWNLQWFTERWLQILLVICMICFASIAMWLDATTAKRNGYPKEGLEYACVHMHLRSGWLFRDAEGYCRYYRHEWWERGGKEKYKKSVKKRPM